MSYYKTLFTLASPKAIKECTGVVERKVTSDMAFTLLKTFTMEEVVAAVK